MHGLSQCLSVNYLKHFSLSLSKRISGRYFFLSFFLIMYGLSKTKLWPFAMFLLLFNFLLPDVLWFSISVRLFVCTSGGCWASTKTFLQLVPFLQNFWELEVKSEKLSPPLNTTILLPIYLPTYRSTFPATQVNEKLFEALNYILSNLNRIVFCIFQRQNLVKKWKAWLNRSM